MIVLLQILLIVILLAVLIPVIVREGLLQVIGAALLYLGMAVFALWVLGTPREERWLWLDGIDFRPWVGGGMAFVLFAFGAWAIREKIRELRNKRDDK